MMTATTDRGGFLARIGREYMLGVLRAAAEELATSTILLFVFVAAALAVPVLAVISAHRVRQRRSGRRRV
jgi:hypothetical protein